MEQPKFSRIHIVGGPGSGKTTLARQLAARLNAPAYDLDEIGYEGGSGLKRSLEVRLNDISQIVASPAWVTEGIYLGWTDRLVQAADAVICLDLAWEVAARRIVQRHILADRAGTNRHPGLSRLVGFMRWAKTYYTDHVPIMPVVLDDDTANSRTATALYLAAYMKKVVHCRQPADVEAFLADF